MANIPRIDLTIPLFDRRYAFRHTEGDASTTLGRMCMEFNAQAFGDGDGFLTTFHEAFFPAYNSLNSPMTPTPQNRSLANASAPAFAVSGAPATSGVCFDGVNILILDTTNINTVGGLIGAKLLTWPGAVDYSSAGMVNLNITNPSTGGLDSISFGGIFPAIFADGSRGFIVQGFSDTRGFILLPVSLNLATLQTWIVDPKGANGNTTVSSPVPGAINLEVDFTTTPAISFYKQVYTITAGLMSVTTSLHSTGTVTSADALNAILNYRGLTPEFYPEFGLFGIDFNSGNDTGCWYLKYDCTAFGHIDFPMPDGSLGPSSSPTVFWVSVGASPPNNSVPESYYPSYDQNGVWWWIRVPLTDGIGNMVIEPLTGEVYNSLGPVGIGGAVQATFTSFFGPGHVGGGTI